MTANKIYMNAPKWLQTIFVLSDGICCGRIGIVIECKRTRGRSTHCTCPTRSSLIAGRKIDPCRGSCSRHLYAYSFCDSVQLIKRTVCHPEVSERIAESITRALGHWPIMTPVFVPSSSCNSIMYRFTILLMIVMQLLASHADWTRNVPNEPGHG